MQRRPGVLVGWRTRDTLRFGEHPTGQVTRALSPQVSGPVTAQSLPSCRNSLVLTLALPVQCTSARRHSALHEGSLDSCCRRQPRPEPDRSWRGAEVPTVRGIRSHSNNTKPSANSRPLLTLISELYLVGQQPQGHVDIQHSIPL